MDIRTYRAAGQPKTQAGSSKENADVFDRTEQNRTEYLFTPF